MSLTSSSKPLNYRFQVNTYMHSAFDYFEKGKSIMKVFFDESGQTGCIIPNKRGSFYNEKQRFFVLGGIICKSDEDEATLSEKYKAFLDKHGINEEFKGSDIMKKENNALLLDFLDSMVDDEHIYICCYDKLFYLATLINAYFYPRSVMNEEPIFYFTQASALAHEKPEIFKKYCECNAIGTEAASMDFCKYIVNYNFQKIDPELNGYIAMARLAIENGEAFDFPLPLGCYLNPNYTNIINMTAVGESIVVLKSIYNITNSEVHIIHDRIVEFENEFIDSMKPLGIDIQFRDSKDELLLQYADNVASIFRKCCSETVSIFESGKQWDSENSWFPTIYSKMLRKIQYKNVKWVVSISDQVLPLCVQEMFSEDFPGVLKNNRYFFKRFAENKEWVLSNIDSLDYSISL